MGSSLISFIPHSMSMKLVMVSVWLSFSMGKLRQKIKQPGMASSPGFLSVIKFYTPWQVLALPWNLQLVCGWHSVVHGDISYGAFNANVCVV